jgi:hypothetical protein
MVTIYGYLMIFAAIWLIAGRWFSLRQKHLSLTS